MSWGALLTAGWVGFVLGFFTAALLQMAREDTDD